MEFDKWKCVVIHGVMASVFEWPGDSGVFVLSRNGI